MNDTMSHPSHALHQAFVKAIEEGANKPTAANVCRVFAAMDSLLSAHCAAMARASVAAAHGAGHAGAFASVMEEFTPIIKWLVDHPLPASPGVDQAIADGCIPSDRTQH